MVHTAALKIGAARGRRQDFSPNRARANLGNASRKWKCFSPTPVPNSFRSSGLRFAAQAAYCWKYNEPIEISGSLKAASKRYLRCGSELVDVQRHLASGTPHLDSHSGTWAHGQAESHDQ